MLEDKPTKMTQMSRLRLSVVMPSKRCVAAQSLTRKKLLEKGIMGDSAGDRSNRKTAVRMLWMCTCKLNFLVCAKYFEFSFHLMTSGSDS